MKLTLYAIFKNQIHVGNQPWIFPDDAIKNYIIESMLGDFVEDATFVKQYSSTLAIKGVHYNLSQSKKHDQLSIK